MPMRFADFDAVLFDVDGTLLAHSHALPGAVATLEAVAQAGVKLALVTNNSATGMSAQMARLNAAGLNVPREAVYTSGSAMCDWIRQRWSQPRIFNFAGEAVVEELPDATFVTTADGEVDVVTVGSHHRENAIDFDLDSALIALHHLRGGAELLIGSSDRVYMYDGQAEFGSGSWGALFAYGADVPAARMHCAGKPDPEFFSHLCDRLDVSPKRCLLVGDNLEADIAGGHSVGMKTALVLTGVTSREQAAANPIKPHAIFEDIVALNQAMA